MNGRFLCFAPISSVSLQNRSKFDPIYQRPDKNEADAVDERENEGNVSRCSRKEPQQQDAGDEEQHSLHDEPCIHDVVEW